MGVNQSTTLPHYFEEIKSWPWSRVAHIIKAYIDEEYDFGLDTTAVSALTGYSLEDSKAVVLSLSKNDTGIINAISLLTIFISLAESSQRLEQVRLHAIFDLLDFNQSAQVNMDALCTLFVCVSSAHAAILGKKKTPSEQLMMQMTGNMYESLKRSFNSTVTRDEFTKWASNTFETLGIPTVESVFELFCSGGPVIQEEEPEDGIPKLFDVEDAPQTDNKVLKTPVKTPIFHPSGDVLTEPIVVVFEDKDEEEQPAEVVEVVEAKLENMKDASGEMQEK